MDFVSVTGVRLFNKSHNARTHVATAAEAFGTLSRALSEAAARPIFHGEVGRVTSLAPFGPKNAMWGLPVAPFFLRQSVWAPGLAAAIGGASRARDFAFPVGKLPAPSPLPFNPLATAFERSLAANV